jgi:hypothetical protein
MKALIMATGERPDGHVKPDRLAAAKPCGISAEQRTF